MQKPSSLIETTVFLVLMLLCVRAFIRPFYSNDIFYVAMVIATTIVSLLIHYSVKKTYVFPIRVNKITRVIVALLLSTGLAVYLLEFVYSPQSDSLLIDLPVYYQLGFALVLSVYFLRVLVFGIVYFTKNTDFKIDNIMTLILVGIAFMAIRFLSSFFIVISEKYPSISRQIGYFILGSFVLLLIKYLFLPIRINKS